MADLPGDETADAAVRALRWVAGAAVPADGGLTWPAIRELGLAQCDDLYYGTAGVLAAFAEARLSGVTEFDATARAAAGRLRHVAAMTAAALRSGDAGAPAGTELGLYSGLAGQAVALRLWADVTGDPRAADTAGNVAAAIAAAAAGGGHLSDFNDLLLGEAGILLAALRLCGPADRSAAAVIADRLVAGADWTDGGPAWLARADLTVEMPNFSHGAAGVGFALGTAGIVLERPDLLAVAQAAGERLVRLGARPGGAIAVPHSVPLRDPDAPGQLRLVSRADRHAALVPAAGVGRPGPGLGGTRGRGPAGRPEQRAARPAVPGFLGQPRPVLRDGWGRRDGA